MKILNCFFTLVLISSALSLRATADDLAVIVNKSNSTTNVTKAQLRKILLGEERSVGGKPAVVILSSPGRPERTGVLKSVCGMTENGFNQHLMQAAFTGSTAPAPTAASSAKAVVQMVMSQPGAIGFVPVADVTDAVKAITVDSVAAGQPNYLVKDK